MNRRLTFLLLGVIFVIALIFRFISLSSFPSGFHIDEASLGYNGYSLLLTGKDDNGHSFPLYIDMFGDNRPSGYHYLTIFPIIFFGLTEFATRFPSALFGSLTVIPLFFLAYVISRNKKIALLSAFFIAISPWHIVISRASGEAIISLFFIILGFSLLLHGLAENKNRLIIWGTVLASFSYFFYHTARLFVPLLLMGLIIFLYDVWRKKDKLRMETLGSFIFLSAVALLLVFVIKGGTGRYGQVNVFNNFQTNFFISQERQEDSLQHSPVILSRIVHNKITNVIRVFFDNYLNYFSGSFLFTQGGLPNWYIVPRMGLIYVIELPFLLLGLYMLVRNKNRWSRFSIVWLIAAPVASAITMDDIPNVNRAIVMVPALEIIVATGLVSAFSFFRNKMLIKFLIVFLFVGNIFYFTFQYFVNAPVHTNWYRNNGFSKMMDVVGKNYANYDTIVISKFQGGIYPLVLFYSKYNPAEYQEEGSPKSKDYGGFGKFHFVPQDCPSVQRSKNFPGLGKKLFIDKGDCPPSKVLEDKKAEFIYKEDRTKAFRIIYE